MRTRLYRSAIGLFACLFLVFAFSASQQMPACGAVGECSADNTVTVAWAPPDGNPTKVPGDDITFEAWLDADGRLRIADLPVLAMDECGICDLCPAPGDGIGHIASDTPSGFATRGDGWHINEACLVGLCSDEHPYDVALCRGSGRDDVLSLSLEDFSALWAELRDGTVAAPDLADLYPANVEWNADRQALQVFDCTGTLLAHVPVNAQ
ncbi:MAG: hypothetical protein OXQ93_07905 [Gemmatimonadota bacterium]|nr:hypothetical protein [bacterium]MDE2875347.1 hypothetical protein [Gemmatimonadota bacterium]